MTIDTTVKLTDILTISAIVIGPVAALMVQRLLDRTREHSRRQRDIFRTIWETRAFPGRLQLKHVEALNRVALDFANRPKVIDAWKEYLDMLINTPEPAEEVQKAAFYRDRDARFIDFIYAMSQALHYKSTRLEVQKQHYSPQAHGTWAEQEAILREGVVALFKDQKPLPIRVVPDEPVRPSIDLSAIHPGMDEDYT